MYSIHKDAKLLWNYLRLDQPVRPADTILAFGSHDINVAKRAAELYMQKYAKRIIFTGGLGRITKNIWKMPESEKFSEIAAAAGVPPEKIITESKSSNTGENIAFTRKKLSDLAIDPGRCIVVDKPFKERRTFAALKKQWPELDFSITSPQLTYEEYCRMYRPSLDAPSCPENATEKLRSDRRCDPNAGHVGHSPENTSDMTSDVTFDDFISIMVGDVQRMDIYAASGLQIPQDIPQSVRDAFSRLASHGYDTQLLKTV